HGTVLATAQLKDGLFCFNTCPSKNLTRSTELTHSPPSKLTTLTSDIDSFSISPSEFNPALISQETTKDTTKLLHSRLGHIGSHLLKNLDISTFSLPLIRNDVQDFQIDTKTLANCDICNSCKQVEKINRGPAVRSSTPLELIHSDTWGKCRVPGIFGSSYFVSFTDDASRESTIYVLKSLKEVRDSFGKYKQQKELQTDNKIKAMRFDGGSEYKLINFGGIIQQTSAPYTQHQNGVSERLNRTLITMARCILAHSGLPLRFWDAAVLTACYLRNKLPLLPDKRSPYEVMNGRKPEVSHLKVWGCLCYVLIDTKDPRRYKLSPTSLKGIFVGYCESSKQYRVYIPTKAGRDKVVTSANVRFFEDSFWDWSTSGDEQYGNLEDALENDYTNTLFHPLSNNLDSDEFVPSTSYPSSPSCLPSLPSSPLSIPSV
ncbi:hypothetical protein K3495_g15685, partial [Podosphaera aphanis]